MINLAISLSSGTAAFFILWRLTTYYQWGIVGALALFFGLNYFLSKRIMRKVESLMQAVAKDLQAQKFDRAVRTLKSGYSLGDWQFFVRPQLKAQIGVIYYLTKEDETAFEYLKDCFSKHWVAMGMLAILHMKKKDKDMMVKTFEKAVKATPKESLLWSLYAYCMLKEGDRDKALEVLSRGLKRLPDDDKLKANHTAVSNKERMKMRNYGEMWTQFYMEKSPPVGQKVPHYMQALAQAQGGRRRIIRR
jgi:tetratricopeptide (TPR) repeat protein